MKRSERLEDVESGANFVSEKISGSLCKDADHMYHIDGLGASM